MTLPTPADQRRDDIDRMYDASLPWVQTAQISGHSYSVRMVYGPDPAWAKVDDAFARAEAGCFIRVDDLASPTKGMTITVAGVSWTVTMASRANDQEWRLALERNVKVRF